MSNTLASKNPINPEFDRLMKIAHELHVKDQKWSVSVLISLATSLAVEVNSVVSLPGSLKKQLVIDVVKALLDEAVKESTEKQGETPGGLSADELKTLVSFAENALPVVLDTLIAVARGKIDLKKIVPQKLSWPKWAGCFVCSASSLEKVVMPVVAAEVPEPSRYSLNAMEIRVPEMAPAAETNSPVALATEMKTPTPAAHQSSTPQPDMSEEKPVETETPPQKNTDTEVEVPSVVEVSPPILLEKSEVVV